MRRRANIVESSDEEDAVIHQDGHTPEEEFRPSIVSSSPSTPSRRHEEESPSKSIHENHDDSDQEDLPTGFDVIQTIQPEKTDNHSHPDISSQHNLDMREQHDDAEMVNRDQEEDDETSDESDEDYEKSELTSSSDMKKKDKLSLKRDMQMLLLKNQISLPTTKSKLNIDNFLKSRGIERTPKPISAETPRNAVKNDIDVSASRVKVDRIVSPANAALILAGQQTAPELGSDSEAELEIIDIKDKKTTAAIKTRFSASATVYDTKSSREKSKDPRVNIPISRAERNRELLLISEQQAKERRERIIDEKRKAIEERKQRKAALKAQRQKMAIVSTVEKKEDQITVPAFESSSEKHDVIESSQGSPGSESKDSNSQDREMHHITLHYSQENSDGEDDKLSNPETSDDTAPAEMVKVYADRLDDEAQNSPRAEKQFHKAKDIFTGSDHETLQDCNSIVLRENPLLPSQQGSLSEVTDSQSLLGLLSGNFEESQAIVASMQHVTNPLTSMPLAPQNGRDDLNLKHMNNEQTLAKEDEELLSLLSGNFNPTQTWPNGNHEERLLQNMNNPLERGPIDGSSSSVLLPQSSIIRRIKIEKKIKRHAFVEAEAEVEEDEFMFLGGADGDDDGIMNAEDLAMLDDDSEIEDSGDKILSLHQKQMKEKEDKEIADLLNDVTSGNLRKRMAKADGSGKGFDLYDSDEENEALLRKIRAQHGFFTRKKTDSDDEDGPTSLKKLAKNPETKAFASCFDIGFEDKDGFISSDAEEISSLARNEADKENNTDTQTTTSDQNCEPHSHGQNDQLLDLQTSYPAVDESDDEDILLTSQMVSKTKKNKKALISDDEDTFHPDSQISIGHNRQSHKRVLIRDTKDPIQTRQPLVDISKSMDDVEDTAAILRQYSQKRRKHNTNSTGNTDSLFDVATITRHESNSRLLSKSSLATMDIKQSTSTSMEGTVVRSINKRGMSFRTTTISQSSNSSALLEQKGSVSDGRSTNRLDLQMDDKSAVLTKLFSRT